MSWMWVDSGGELVRDVWPDVPNDWTADLYFEAAQEQCIEYITDPIADDSEIPARWQLAVILQARALWQAAVSDTQDGIGEGGFRVSVFPMDWTVKNLLKPKRGVPVVG